VHPLVRLVERLAPDLAVYAGNDPYCYESDVPALVPVFDLMHRYEPSFKGSAGGAVERRETHFRRLCASARGLLVDSTVGRAHVLECYGVDPAKVFILPYVAPSYIGRLKGSGDAVRKFGLPADYVFYPAQLRKHKNHVGLLRALAVLRHRGLVVHAVFAGSSLSGAAELFETVTALGLRDQVQYLSYVNDAEIVGLYEHAKALVMPTFFGPTNIPPLEAFILGCPVVTSGIYGIPEQLGDAALFCDPRNPEDIADKVARVWLDTDLRRVLIERGYRHAARWNQSHFDERFGAIVEACLAGQGPSLDVSALGKSGGIPVPMRD
jgi:glycosyltransferase involved in cell wall biosynthesis